MLRERTFFLRSNSSSRYRSPDGCICADSPFVAGCRCHAGHLCVPRTTADNDAGACRAACRRAGCRRARGFHSSACGGVRGWLAFREERAGDVCRTWDGEQQRPAGELGRRRNHENGRQCRRRRGCHWICTGRSVARSWQHWWRRVYGHPDGRRPPGGGGLSRSGPVGRITRHVPEA